MCCRSRQTSGDGPYRDQPPGVGSPIVIGPPARIDPDRAGGAFSFPFFFFPSFRRPWGGGVSPLFRSCHEILLDYRGAGRLSETWQRRHPKGQDNNGLVPPFLPRQTETTSGSRSGPSSSRCQRKFMSSRRTRSNLPPPPRSLEILCRMAYTSLAHAVPSNMNRSH